MRREGLGCHLQNLGRGRQVVREPLKDPGKKAVLSILAFSMSHSMELRVHLRTLRQRLREAPNFLAPTGLHFPAPLASSWGHVTGSGQWTMGYGQE